MKIKRVTLSAVEALKTTKLTANQANKINGGRIGIGEILAIDDAKQSSDYQKSR